MKNLNYIFLLAISIFIFSCQGSDLEKMKTADQVNMPDEISKDVVLIYSDSGIVKRRLEAELIHKFILDSNSYTEFPNGVFAQFYDKNGVVTSQLKAGYCKKFDDSEDLTFKKHVVIKNSKKETFITHEIFLKGDRIFSDTTVFVKTPAGILRGTSLVAPKDLSSWEIKNPTGVGSVEEFEKSGI